MTEETIIQPKTDVNVKTEKKQRSLANLKPYKKGQSGNPNGRPEGTKNFSTIMDEVIQEIAVENKITFQEAQKILFKRAFSEAKNGNYQFWDAIMVRYYGKPVERTQNVNLNIEISREDQEKINKALDEVL